MNMTVENHTVTGVEVFDISYSQETITSASVTTWPAGTVLARDNTTGKIGLYSAVGSDGLNIPLAVLPNDVDFTVAGDLTESVIIKGEVKRDRLIVGGSAITAREVTIQEVDALRSFGIIARSISNLTEN